MDDLGEANISPCNIVALVNGDHRLEYLPVGGNARLRVCQAENRGDGETDKENIHTSVKLLTNRFVVI